MARAEASVEINCPVHTVFAYLTDIDQGTQWQAELIEAQQTSTGPVGVGTTIREVRRFMGRQMESVFKITEHEPDRRLYFESTSGPLPMRGHYNIEPLDEGARVTVVVEAELTGVFRMTEPLVVHSAKRQLDTDLAKLKALLEARASV